MKKLTSLILFFVASIAVHAQLKVFSTGNTNIKRSTEFTFNALSVGEHTHPTWFGSNYQNGTHSFLNNQSSKFNIAIYGDSHADNIIGSGRSIGVLGVGENSTNGYNYGVFGRLGGSQNGAGIYGTIYSNVGTYVNDRYAGFFEGPVYVIGALTASSVTTPSDIRLKENITMLADVERGKTLEKVLGMNVIEYNYKARGIPTEEKDTIQSNGYDVCNADLQKDRHYGLIAQELQTIYPNLVKEEQDGYLGVNYVELVPILVRSIQELNQKIDALEGKLAARAAASTSGILEDAEAPTAKNVLYQNSPNPFKEQTVIRFRLANNAQDASIRIFDMTGKQLRKLSVSPAENSVTIPAYELGEGLYLYSLVVNGLEIDTKKMIISK